MFSFVSLNASSHLSLFSFFVLHLVVAQFPAQALQIQKVDLKVTYSHRPVTWNDAADVMHEVHVGSACVPSPHGFQHGVTSALGWQVKLPTHIGSLLDQSQHLKVKSGMNIRHALGMLSFLLSIGSSHNHQF